MEGRAASCSLPVRLVSSADPNNISKSNYPVFFCPSTPGGTHALSIDTYTVPPSRQLAGPTLRRTGWGLTVDDYPVSPSSAPPPPPRTDTSVLPQPTIHPFIRRPRPKHSTPREQVLRESLADASSGRVAAADRARRLSAENRVLAEKLELAMAATSSLDASAILLKEELAVARRKTGSVEEKLRESTTGIEVRTSNRGVLVRVGVSG